MEGPKFHIGVVENMDATITNTAMAGMLGVRLV
jgi:hypothetical protein